MKKHWTKMLASELLAETRIIDNDAETIYEIMAKTGHGRSAMRRRIKEMIAAGKIEKVWKRRGTAIIMAYRAKKIS